MLTVGEAHFKISEHFIKDHIASSTHSHPGAKIKSPVSEARIRHKHPVPPAAASRTEGSARPDGQVPLLYSIRHSGKWDTLVEE